MNDYLTRLSISANLRQCKKKPPLGGGLNYCLLKHGINNYQFCSNAQYLMAQWHRHHSRLRAAKRFFKLSTRLYDWNETVSDLRF